MKREELENLGLSEEQITGVMKLKSSAMSELENKVNSLEEEKKGLQTQLDTTKETLTKLESEDIESIKNELQSYKDKEAQRVANEEKATKEKALNERIERAFGDSKFINEFTRKQMINEMKNALEDESNTGKSDIEIFNSITKDQENIFVNPNQPTEIPPMGEVETNNTKERPIIW